MSARTRAVEEGGEPVVAGSVRTHGVALGFLAMLPLLVAYEASVGSGRDASRNLAEVLASLPFSVHGEHAALGGRAALAALAFAAAWRCFHEELGLAPRILRIAF
ncbi:MAG: hypothetical protein HZA53_06370 [Planctomycetes bacterium]|nr:hypothetical protein [Planctomycetota bacterium]